MKRETQSAWVSRSLRAFVISAACLGSFSVKAAEADPEKRRASDAIQRCLQATSANKAVEQCDDAIQVVDAEPGDASLAARVFQARGAASLRNGASAEAIPYFRKAINLAESAGDEVTLADARVTLATSLRLSNRLAEAYVPLLLALTAQKQRVEATALSSRRPDAATTDNRDRVAALLAFSAGLTEKAQLCLANSDARCAEKSAQDACDLQLRADALRCGADSHSDSCVRVAANDCHADTATVLRKARQRSGGGSSASR